MEEVLTTAQSVKRGNNMQTIETNNLIFEDQTDISYFNDLVFYVDKHEQEVLEVFRIPELSSKWKVIIMPFEDFKNLMIKNYGGYEDYMAGHANSDERIIRCLNVEDQIKYTKHKEANLERLQKMIIHEFVHACYSEVVIKGNRVHWFNEGLATYLSHQDRDFKDISNIDFNLLLNNFYATHGAGYTPAYLIEKYIFENYSSEEIYKMIIDPDYLISKTKDIINESVEWIKERVNNNTKK